MAIVRSTPIPVPTLCCFNEKENNHLLPLVLRASYFYNGEAFLAKLYQEFSERSNEVICGQLADIVEEILPKNKTQNDDVAVRIMKKDGFFHNIMENKKTYRDRTPHH